MSQKTEKIGSVLLDTSFYHDNDAYSDGDETENRLLELVSSCPEEDYPRLIMENPTWPILYHLSPMRESIVSWIPVQKGEKVLELGAGCGAVTGAFLGKGLQVTAVDLSRRRSLINATRHKNAEDLTIYVGAAEEVLAHLSGTFDHVTLIGVLEYAAVFSEAKKPFHYLLNMAGKAMKPDGSLWVAIENKLGLKYFAGRQEDHTARYFEGIEDYPHGDGACTFSRKELTELAAECGFDSEFYYPYPDYKFPVKIFSDAYLPKEGELNRNWQTFDADRVVLFDETHGFDNIIRAGLFPELSNSFLVRLTRKDS